MSLLHGLPAVQALRRLEAVTIVDGEAGKPHAVTLADARTRDDVRPWELGRPAEAPAPCGEDGFHPEAA